MSLADAAPVLVAREGPLAILTLNQPAKRNALSMAMRAMLAEAFEEIEGDAEIRAVVLTGSGGHFCSGGDLGAMDIPSLAAGRERMRRSHRLVRAMVESRVPIVCAIEGWCAGAGISLACASDHVVAAGDALFRATFGQVGLIPDLGLLHTLPRRVGEGRAREILLFGETIKAARAHEIGLVDRLAPPGRALEEAKARALLLAAKAPLSLALTKAALAEGLARSLARERDLQAALFLTADHAEGKRAFFDKRAPEFRGE